MYLMFYLDEQGKRVYTLKVGVGGRGRGGEGHLCHRLNTTAIPQRLINTACK